MASTQLFFAECTTRSAHPGYAVEMNGETPQPETIDRMIRANLKLHRVTFARLAETFHLSHAVEQAAAAAKLLATGSVTPADYLNFLKQHLPVMAENVADRIRSEKSAGSFAGNQAVRVLANYSES